MSSEKPVLGYEEPDRDADFKPVTEQAPDRRRLIRRLVTLAGLGITSVLLSQEKIGLLPRAEAGYGSAILIDEINTGTGNVTELDSSTFSVSSTGYDAVLGETENASGTGVEGYATSSIGDTTGVYGHSDSTGGTGVEGLATATTGFTQGVYGKSVSTSGTGVNGAATATTGTPVGVLGVTEGASYTPLMSGMQGVANTGYGVYGKSSTGTGVYGETAGSGAGAVTGHATSTTGQNAGVSGFTDSNGGYGVYGKANNASGGTGICGLAGASGTGVIGQALAPNCTPLIAQGISGQTANLQQWQISSGSAWNILSVVDANGNFGIGTSTPARSVHLVGHNANFRMDRDIDTSAFILVRTAAGNFSKIWKTFYVGVNASGVNNGYFFIGDNAANTAGTSTTRLIIDNTGRVGLGRTPTANHLEVEGTASKTTAGSWLANSDMRIKTDIEDIDDALATIRKLHPVRFRYTDSYKAKHPSIKNHPYYNFIAQEYREVFPDSVQDDGEGLLQMDSYNTTPYLVRAVQELSKQNETLTERDSEQQKTIERLQERIDVLENSMKQFTSS